MRLYEGLLPLAVGLILLGIFWSPLCTGGGLIGGDLYPYYFPQKQYLTTSLHAGSIPLWNNLVGLGYPVLGESQTGALYPPNLILFRLFDINTAYNLSQLLHYLLTFLGTYCLSRQLGQGRGASVLAAVTYVFGWFPARICLEWAILGGAFQIWMLWLVVTYRQTGARSLLGAMSLLLGTHLLAGHYNLAFITLLVVGVLAVVPQSWLNAQPAPGKPESIRFINRLGWLSGAIACGFVVAAVQLLPTWELRGLSQRAETGEAFAPGYGHLPPLAVTQLAAPWLWHGAELDADQALQSATWGTIPAATNKAEAYVYAGIIPLLLVLYGWLKLRSFEAVERQKILLWSGLLVASLFFATGWPIIWLQNVPGFAFFMGPGRYTIVTTLAVAIISGIVLDDLLRDQSTLWKCMVFSLVTFVTIADLWGASREYSLGRPEFFGRQVFYATLVDQPATSRVASSEIKAVLDQEPGLPRLYGPGPNVLTMTGYSAIPVYLGIGPKAYVDRQLRFEFTSDASAEGVQATLNQLYELGVTHLVQEQPVRTDLWPVELIFSGVDPWLNPVFGRREPYFVYRLPRSPGRVRFDPADSGIATEIRSEPGSVSIAVTMRTPGRVILSELNYPGWQVLVDRTPATPASATDFREVSVDAGEHQIIWQYRPQSIRLGMVASILGTLLALGVIVTAGRTSTQISRQQHG